MNPKHEILPDEIRRPQLYIPRGDVSIFKSPYAIAPINQNNPEYEIPPIAQLALMMSRQEGSNI